MPPLTPSQFCNYTPNYHGSCCPRRVCTTISIHRSNFSLEANWKTKSVGSPFVGQSFTPDPAGEHTVLPACCPLPSHSWYVAPHCVAHQCFWHPSFHFNKPMPEQSFQQCHLQGTVYIGISTYIHQFYFNSHELTLLIDIRVVCAIISPWNIHFQNFKQYVQLKISTHFETASNLY